MAKMRHISPFRWVFLALIGAGIAGGCYLVAGGKTKAGTAAADNAGGVYAADIPLAAMPQQIFPGYILLSPQDLARVPEVDGFQWPCGSPDGAMTYDAQPFGSPNEKRGGFHTGMDINGIGGENTDEGMPVHASARGLVIYSGVPSEGWGDMVVLAHRLPGTDRIVQTLYAHLNDRGVKQGQLVTRGRRIGSIGTANGHYLAHLHFEAIESRCVEAGMPGYHPDGTMNRLDPEKLLAEYPAPAFPDAADEVRRLRVQEIYNQSAPAAPEVELPSGTIPLNPSQFTKP